MAYTATSTGKTRPKNTQTILNADGSTGTVTWVRLDSLIKRIRRHLAKKNHRLLITSEGDLALAEYGQYAVLDADGHPLQTHANLPALARFLGQLADDEMIEPAERDWLFHIAKKHSAIIEGRVWLERVSRDFRTERAARMALEAIEDRAGLVIIGDAAREDSTEAMAKVWEREQQARQAAALAEIEAAIEANPTLRYLRSEAGSERAWGAAVAFDLQLQNDPAWTQKPISDRLNEVARLMVETDLVSKVSV